MNEINKRMCTRFGIAFTMSLAILFYSQFLIAFFNGIYTGVWRSGMDINSLNEAIPEFFMIPIGIALGFWYIKTKKL